MSVRWLDRLRSAWRALMGTTAITAPQEPERNPHASQAMLLDFQRKGATAFAPQAVYEAMRPLNGVLPDGMAFDDALPNFDAVTSYALQQAFHEGIGFLGYPYLAELAQRAEYRKIASIWAEHCTRKWIDLTGQDEKLAELQTELERLNVRQLFREAIEKECFFGRCQLFLDFGDFDKPRELSRPLVLKPGKINPNRPLKRITLVEPLWSYPGAYSAQNPLAPDFYNPQCWYVSGRTVHASRLLTLVGNSVPNMLKPAYAFGGLSMSQLCKPYIDNWLRTRQSVSDLVHSFSVMVLKTDMEQVLQGGSTIGTGSFKLSDRVQLFNLTRDNRGTFVLDKGSEEFDNVSAPIAGLHELQAQAQEQMSSVSGIPLVILLGITPSGLNASSEGEFRVFYDAIMAYLNRVVAEPLKTVLDAVQLSLWGVVDEKITHRFLSLWEMSEVEKATVRKTDADTDAVYMTNGVVDNEEVRDRLNNEETSLYHGKLTGPAPEPEQDEKGVAEDSALPFAIDAYQPDQQRDAHGRWSRIGAILQHVTKVLAGKGNHPPLSLGKTTSANVALVQRQTGINLTGYTRSLESSDIRHTIASHGEPQREQARGQRAVTKQDFGRIPDIVETAHTVRAIGDSGARKLQRLEYTATIDGAEYRYVEEVRPSKTIVALKTMRIELGEGGARGE